MSKRKKTIKQVHYKVSITGLQVPKGAIAFSALRRIIDILSDGSERALRLALEGGSVKKGPIPTWLAKSTDFILTGMRPGSTILELGVPTLGEIASEQIQQQDLWNTVPQPEETALTLLSKSIIDAEKEDLESERYDSGILETLLGFKKILEDNNLNIRLTSETRKQDNFKIDNAALQKIEKLKIETPEPQAVLLTGFCNMIKHSQRRFDLTLEDGRTVHGKIDEKAIALEQLRNLWGKKVTIKGIIYFTASKKPRLLEAQIITPSQIGDEAFKAINLSLPTMEIVSKVREKSNKKIVSDIWGKWPGDENVDDLINALKESRNSD
ncbi:MAG: hypothetical protein QME25_03255 [Bacteroidota bacterium]|nr:hypothetical protein [Bacteroidota bacterium]